MGFSLLATAHERSRSRDGHERGRKAIGVLSASTAFGKTVMAAYLIAQRKVNTPVIVHRRQLLDQWVGTLSQFLGLDRKEIGQIGGGKHRPTGKIDVAMVQSLSRQGVVDDIMAQYGYLMWTNVITSLLSALNKSLRPYTGPPVPQRRRNKLFDRARPSI